MFRYGTERGIAFTRTRPYRKNDNCLVEVIKFDQARTPYQRILASPHVPERAKAELTRTYIELNPAELKQQIATCQERLLHINRTKPDRTKEVNRPTHVRQLAPA